MSVCPLFLASPLLGCHRLANTPAAYDLDAVRLYANDRIAAVSAFHPGGSERIYDIDVWAGLPASASKDMLRSNMTAARAEANAEKEFICSTCGTHWQWLLDRAQPHPVFVPVPVGQQVGWTANQTLVRRRAFGHQALSYLAPPSLSNEDWFVHALLCFVLVCCFCIMYAFVCSSCLLLLYDLFKFCPITLSCFLLCLLFFCLRLLFSWLLGILHYVVHLFWNRLLLGMGLVGPL